MVTLAVRPPVLCFLPGSCALTTLAVGIEGRNVFLTLYALTIAAFIAELVGTRALGAGDLIVNFLEEVRVLAL